MKQEKTQRIFIIGCSRSGTTLLQRSLYESLNLITIPETDFFNTAAGGGILKQYLTLLGIAGRRSQKALENANKIMNLCNYRISGYEKYVFKNYVNPFITNLDVLAKDCDKDGWIEKTPKHFKQINLIENYVPDAKFIHIIRNGPDVVASIVDRAYSYPGHFVRQKDPKYAIRTWNQSIKVALKYHNKTNHIIVEYEALCNDSCKIINKIASKFNLNYRINSSKFINRSEFITSKEYWKADVDKPIQLRPSKFDKVFTHQEGKKILSKLNMQSYLRLIKLIDS